MFQEILDSYVSNWRKPFGMRFEVVEERGNNWKVQAVSLISGNKWIIIKLHELFSKDSWIMEFAKRKPTMSFWDWNLKVRYNEMSDMTAEEKLEYFIRNVTI